MADPSAIRALLAITGPSEIPVLASNRPSLGAYLIFCGTGNSDVQAIERVSRARRHGPRSQACRVVGQLTLRHWCRGGRRSILHLRSDAIAAVARRARHKDSAAVAAVAGEAGRASSEVCWAVGRAGFHQLGGGAWAGPWIGLELPAASQRQERGPLRHRLMSRPQPSAGPGPTG